MSSHTPGPWEVRTALPYTDSEVVVFSGRHAENVSIARVLWAQTEIGEANARLITAAPDLLDAVQQYLWARAHGDGRELLNAIMSMRAAVHKTEV